MAELIVASRPKTDPSMLWPSVAIQVGEELLRAGPRGTEWWFDNPFQLSYVLAEPTPDPHHEHIRKQVARLAAVEPGWLDGAGDRCDQQGLKRLETQLIRYYPRTAPELLLSPTEDGDAFAEWWLGDHIPSLEIFLDGSPAVWHDFDTGTRTSIERELDLNDRQAWEWIVSQLQSYRP